MLVVAVISVDAYPFLFFLDLTCHLDDTGIVFSGCTSLPDSKENKLGSSDQEAFPSACKISGIVLAWKCGSVSLQLFLAPWVSFFMAYEFSVRVTKLLQGLVSHELIACLSIFNLFLTH